MPAAAIAAALGGATSAVAGAIDTKNKQKLADKQGFQNTTEQLLNLKREREQKSTKEKQITATSNKTLTIVGGVVFCVFLLGLFMFLIKRKS